MIRSAYYPPPPPPPPCLFPISSPCLFSEALKLYRSKLSAFEQTEIPDFPEIYFLGLEAKKIEGVPGGAQNNGYDDENGSYIKVGRPEVTR